MGINQPGQQRANHKYIARAEVNGHWRYFYNQNEINAYKKQKKSGVSGEFTRIKKKGKNKNQVKVTLPEGRMAVASTGKIISGYRGLNEKPPGYSDEAWEQLKEMWTVRRTASEPAKTIANAKKRKKAVNRRIQVTPSSGYRSSGSSGSSGSSSSGSSGSSSKSYTPIKVTANDVFKATNTLLGALTALRKKKS